ncbi:MAG: hypothetical protein AAB215_03905 [Planctomycetota bacterium]
MRTDALWMGGILAAAGIAVGAILLHAPSSAPVPAQPPMPPPPAAKSVAPFDPLAGVEGTEGALPETGAPGFSVPTLAPALPAPPPAASVPTVLRTMSARDGVRIQPGESPGAPVLVVDPFPEDGPIPAKAALKAGRKAAGGKTKEKAKAAPMDAAGGE